MKNLFYIFAFVAVSLAACSPCRNISNTTELMDSFRTETTVVYRDTAIYIPADSAKIKAMVPGCPDIEIKGENGRALLRLKIKDGVLKAECISKAYAEKFRFYFTQTNTERIRKQSVKSSYVKRERFTPGFVKFLAWSGGIIIGLFMLWLIIKIVIKYIKPI